MHGDPCVPPLHESHTNGQIISFEQSIWKRDPQMIYCRPENCCLFFHSHSLFLLLCFQYNCTTCLQTSPQFISLIAPAVPNVRGSNVFLSTGTDHQTMLRAANTKQEIMVRVIDVFWPTFDISTRLHCSGRADLKLRRASQLSVFVHKGKPGAE